MTSSPSHLQIPVNDINDEEENSDREASEEQEQAVDVIEEGEERTGLLNGVLTEEEKGRTATEAYRILVLRILLIMLLILMLVGTIILTIFPPRTHDDKIGSLYSNGTHEFHNTVILVSFDGFRSDYLDRNFTPTIQKFIQKGLKAEYLVPSFPSVTFPNHYSIVTGLYPESHGIVANEFYDPILKDDFFYINPNKSLDSKWWKGEPIWVTTVKQNQKSGVSMWVGSSSVIDGHVPTYSHVYNSSRSMHERIEHIINWLDMELEDRPTFLAGYVSVVDSMGHKFGPDSQEVNKALEAVDDYVKILLNKIEERNLTDIVNIIFVSDHGMAQTIPSNIIFLDNVFNISKIHPLEGFPIGGIRPYNDSDINEIFDLLQNASESQPWTCYLRENIPERFHYRNSVRIAPIICIPPVGWVLTNHRDFNEKLPRGAHGYDNQDPTMRGIFLANGPYFKDKKGGDDGRVVNPFINVEIYNTLCKILGLKPAPNNGTVDGII
ncbi:11458_t:CDS:2 [Funneliformis caledonium]|uniref:11458_t:CDS:1 n=1 Tax=Funneliformis caledonium TaxID=1117310 RepID=A0A9N9DS80_9GLOM|nr:11458_t:CDS:2 [Funneliformis caledonium]